MTLRYRAFLIGNSTYPEDPHNLQSLEGPVNDVTLLRAALEDRTVGLFAEGDVTVRPERTSHELIRALDEFFTTASREDVLLLYFSGHGLLDHTGTLYLCTRDTRMDLLRGTAISSQRLNEMIDASAATRIVIILDCCHSGAFKGTDIAGPLAGQGRYVLTSCRGRELANDASKANHASLFTEYVVQGLRGLAPPRPGAHHVTVEELYGYVWSKLEAVGKQRPQRSFKGEGGLPIARRGAADQYGTSTRYGTPGQYSILGSSSSQPGQYPAASRDGGDPAIPQLRPGYDDKQAAKPKPTRKTRRGLVISLVIVGVVLLALAAIGVIAMSGRDNPNPPRRFCLQESGGRFTSVSCSEP